MGCNLRVNRGVARFLREHVAFEVLQETLSSCALLLRQRFEIAFESCDEASDEPVLVLRNAARLGRMEANDATGRVGEASMLGDDRF